MSSSSIDGFDYPDGTEFSKAAQAYIRRIDEMGGMIPAIEAGFFQATFLGSDRSGIHRAGSKNCSKSIV